MRRDHKRVSLEKEMSIHVLNRSLALVNFSEPPLDSLPIISARLSLASLISSFLEGLMAGRFHLLLLFLPVFLKYFTGCFATCVWLSKCLIFTGRNFFFPKDRLLFHHNGCVLLCVSSVMIKSVSCLEFLRWDFLWVSSSSGLSAFVHSQSASELD